MALVAFGQHRHVQHILAETNYSKAASAENALEGARRLLKVPKGVDPFHRDGWLFQIMAWIAAHLQGQASLIAQPQMRHADKGFDGPHVHIDEGTRMVQSVIICEEKATERPRAEIRDSVWKEFASLERGESDHLLIAEVSTLLATRPDLDADQAVKQIIWKEARAFRVAITIGDTHGSEDGRKHLFKGYCKTIPGEVSRRRAETLHLADLRCCMKHIARKALKAAEKMAEPHV